MSDSIYKNASMRKVYITSGVIAKYVDELPSNEGRASMVSSLIRAYGLESHVLPVYECTKQDLLSFHGIEFIETLLNGFDPDDDINGAVKDLAASQLRKSHSFVPELSAKKTQLNLIKYGLIDDCPIFKSLSKYVKMVSGSSIVCANHLLKNNDICINWYGGRHHCGKNAASGFCYVNDIVLAITRLRNKYKNVFYLDLDVHHGDGVENAFRNSKNVTTCSLHHYDLGFFPGTGSLESCTASTINIPLHKGLCDETLQKLIVEVVIPIIEKKNPDILVIQCGCDGLVSDPCKQWNLTIKGFGNVIKSLVEYKDIPVLILGGGGYNNIETAKCWTYITKLLMGNQEEWDIIPEHEYIEKYSECGYQFWTYDNENKSKMRDRNGSEYLEDIKRFLLHLYEPKVS